MTTKRASPGAPEAPAVAVSRIEALATRQLTPCGVGSMVWRIWGEGRPLVLLHGASGSWTHWIRNILPLARHVRVLAPDMPGFGDSDVPAEPHTADALADLLASGRHVVVPPPTELDIAGAGGMALPRAPIPLLLPIQSDMAPAEIQRVHRENLRILMMANPDKVDDLAVFVQMENIRQARFKSGTIPASDTLLQALPAIRARITGVWGGRDAFAAPRLGDYRRVLASVQSDLDFRVIDGAGHWVPYEAADRVNAALLDMLR